MQLFAGVNQSLPGAERSADELAAVALAVTRLLRAHAWRRRGGDLSDLQLRTLALINAYPGCAPSALADYLLLSRPAVTRVADELVARKLVTRRPAAADRRRIELRATAAGTRRVDAYLSGARAALARRLESLTAAEHDLVRRAMRVLGPRVQPVSPLGADQEDGAAP